MVPFVIVSGLAQAGAIEVVQNNVQVKPAYVPSDLERLMQARDCSSSGLAPGVEPVHSIVRDRIGGAVRLASFDEGWQMYAGDRPGTLVAVCRL
jgi:hypothetical protein